MIASKPKSSSAQGACSREEPQPKLRPGDQDRVRLQLDLAVADPVVEEELAEAGPLDPLEELLGDDLVGVDVGPVQHRHLALDHVYRSHAQLQSLMSTKRPSIGGRGRHLRADQVGAPALALAPLEVAVGGRGAALALGRGCRGSSPGTSSSPPRATRSRRRGRPRAGPRPRRSPSPAGSRGRPSRAPSSATLRPSTIAAASRRSSIRELVQEPMKTRSSATSVIGVPGSRPM